MGNKSSKHNKLKDSIELRDSVDILLEDINESNKILENKQSDSNNNNLKSDSSNFNNSNNLDSNDFNKEITKYKDIHTKFKEKYEKERNKHIEKIPHYTLFFYNLLDKSVRRQLSSGISSDTLLLYEYNEWRTICKYSLAYDVLTNVGKKFKENGLNITIKCDKKYKYLMYILTL